MTTTDEQRAEFIQAARELGEEHARNAASWTVDGNSDVDERRRVLEMLRDGDGAAYDYLPRTPNLSGEFADDPTPTSLARDIMGEWDSLSLVSENEFENEPGELEAALADAYEEGVSETFSLACEAALIAFCGEPQTLADIANVAGSCFETRYRAGEGPVREVVENANAYVTLKDGSPDWIKDAVREAHDGKLPDDYVYKVAAEAFAFIADSDEDSCVDDLPHEFADDVDVYTSDLITWLGSHSARMGYCTQAQEDGLVDVDADVSQRISAGQYVERSLIFGAILSACETQLDD